MSELGDESLMTDYFLGDALGSVRQLTDSNGNLTLSKAYDPYGTVAQTAGAGQSSYGYTAGFQDSFNKSARFLEHNFWY